MKRYILLITILGIIGFLIYFSSIYLVRAERSFKRLAQKTEELEKELPLEESEPVIILTPREEKPVEEKPAEEKPAVPSAPPRISMEFENANLKDVLKIFCQQSGLNFVAGENVELKPITLYLSNVSVDDALNSIIKANGLTYERAKDSDVFIVTRSAEPEIRLETRIFKLKYAFAEDKTITGVDNKEQTIKGVKETVQKLLTPNGDLSVDSRTNSLIITDIPSRFALIEKSIQDLDSQLPQILIEAKIVELQTTDLDQLGIKWSSLSGYTLRLQDPTRTYSSERSGTQTREDVYEEDVSEALKEDLIHYIRENITDESATATIEVDFGRSITNTLTRTLTKSDIRSAILSADDFEVTLSLLLTDTDVDIISNPNIVTAHSKEAKITVGEQYPLPQFTYNSDTASWEMSGFEYKDIGVILRVTPYADTEKENITLELNPEVSSISGYVTFRGAQIPIIATRTAITNVAIKDGDTLAIGGLLRDRDNTVITKVPLLGDIPVLGHLFKHKEDTKTKTNMIIFITPHILKDRRPPAGVGSEVTVPVPIVRAPVTQTVNTPDVVKANNPDKKYEFTHR